MSENDFERLPLLNIKTKGFISGGGSGMEPEKAKHMLSTRITGKDISQKASL